MKANLHSVRIAPKKANLIAKMVRGMPVPAAMESLRRTDKKGARMIEQLLRSAIANASHNDKQDPQMMVIKTIVVNQGTAYRRGMPKARGQTRPYRKFLSHIAIELGFADAGKIQKKQKIQTNEKDAGKSKAASQGAKTPVKTSGSAAKKSAKSKQTSSESSSSSESSASSQ